ncbi:MAG: hypothetical protein WDZ62_02610, partial [Candidatus Pacearchaeota archaeon]
MVKNSLGSLKNLAKYGLLVGTLLFSSCKDTPVGPEEKETPNPSAIVNVSPVEGYSPLEVELMCSGEHPEGVENIGKYMLKVKKENISIESDNPIEISHNFEISGNYGVECSVYSGDKENSDSETVVVHDPGKPRALLNIGETNGRIPFRTNFELDGEHPEGFGIVEYNLKIGEDKFSNSSPIEKNYVFTNSGEENVYAWVIDENGKSSDTTSASIKLEDIVTSFGLVGNNDHPVDLKYSASVGNASDFILKIFRNNESEPLVEKIFSNEFEGSFNYEDHSVTKGDYIATIEPVDLELSNKNNLEKQNGREVPNYSPKFNSSGLNKKSFEFNEEGQITKNLKDRISDPNPEDIPVIKSSQSNDGKTNVSIRKNYDILIEGNNDQFGDYNFGFTIEDNHGGSKQESFEGYIHPKALFNVVMEDNEEEIKRPGEFRAFNFSDEPRQGYVFSEEANGYIQKIMSLELNQSGEAKQKTEQRLSDLSDIILMQFRMENHSTGNPESYIRTVSYKRSDLENILKNRDGSKKILGRVVPYDEGLYSLSEHGVSPDDFYRHMAETLDGWTDGSTKEEEPKSDPINWNPILTKWDFFGYIDSGNAQWSLEEVIISKKHHDEEVDRIFTQESAEELKDRLWNKNNQDY